MKSYTSADGTKYRSVEAYDVLATIPESTYSDRGTKETTYRVERHPEGGYWVVGWHSTGDTSYGRAESVEEAIELVNAHVEGLFEHMLDNVRRDRERTAKYEAYEADLAAWEEENMALVESVPVEEVYENERDFDLVVREKALWPCLVGLIDNGAYYKGRVADFTYAIEWSQNNHNLSPKRAYVKHGSKIKVVRSMTRPRPTRD